MSEIVDYQTPKIYSRISIVVFSILLSTIFGGIMYGQNLSAIGNKQQRTPVFLFCLAWQFIAAKLLREATDNIILSVLVPNLIGGLLLAKPFWDYHFKEVDLVKTRKIWTPIAIVIIIYGGLIGLNLMR